MTVIAADGRIIVADGRTIFTSNSEIARDDTVKLIAKDRRIYGVSGITGLIHVLADWYNAGAKPGDMPPHAPEWALLVIDQDGPCHLGNESPYPLRLRYPVTLGCAADFAMGAMLAGADARRAVEIAISRDCRCGGELTIINIDAALGTQAAVAAE
jgi:hypothetical protein